MDQQIVSVLVLKSRTIAPDLSDCTPIALPSRPANKKSLIEQGNYPKYPAVIICSISPVIVKNRLDLDIFGRMDNLGDAGVVGDEGVVCVNHSQ